MAAYLAQRTIPRFNGMSVEDVINFKPQDEADRVALGQLLLLEFDEKLTSRYLLEQRTEENLKKQEENVRQREAAAPWNEPVTVLWEDWARADLITLEEAAALLHGRDPRRVSVATIDATRLGNLSPFIREFKQTLSLLQRADQARNLLPGRGERFLPQSLTDPPKVTPKSVIEWALVSWVVPGKREVPSEWLLALEQRGISVVDLREKCVGLEQEVESLRLELAEARQAADASAVSSEALLSQITIESSDSKEKELSARERKTFLRLLYVVAVEKYRFKPDELQKNITASRISEDAKVHLGERTDGMSEKNIRDKLKEAAALVRDEKS